MRILQLGKFYPIRGGVEKVMYDLTTGLSERGVDCDMLCACLDGGKTIELNEHGRVICVPAWKKVAATMLSPSMIRWLRKHKDEYDIVHVHHPDPMACLALRLSGYKGRVLVHWHSDILKQKTILKFYKPLQNWMLRRAEKIIGTTPVYVKESPHLVDFQDKVTYVPIGIRPIDFDASKAQEIRAAHSGKKLVFGLGRLVGYKGFTYLVGAAKHLPDDYMVVIGGQGPLKEELEQQIISENLENKVSLLGYMSDDEVRSWLGACDVFALSSIWKTEAFAIVQIEAMSCGKPIVTARIPESGVAWVNEDKDSGLVVPTCDSKALADAIVALTADEEVYRQYSSRSKARYERLFTFDLMIDNILKIYNRK